MLETRYVGLFEPFNINLSIMSVIYLKACSYFVYLDVWIVGVENMKMIDDEIWYRTKECKFVKHTWQQQGSLHFSWYSCVVTHQNYLLELFFIMALSAIMDFCYILL